MSSYLKDVLSSGRKILGDTKQLPPPAQKGEEKGKPKPSSIHNPPETDPHKVFIKRAINERPKKGEMVEEIKKFIKRAEDCL